MKLLGAIFILFPLALCQDQLDNLAFKKPTWQTSEVYSSDKAVDGLYTNRSAAGNQCAISEPHPVDATWWVDLGAVKSVSEVRIYYRYIFEPWTQIVFMSRFSNFSLYLSNTTSKEDGYLCFHENNDVDHMDLELTVRCEGTGRFVIYYNNRESRKPGEKYSKEAYIELCEVQVIGCSLGYLGHGCSNKCPANCNDHCRYSTGECVGICSHGFTGKSCENYERVNMALHRPTYQLNTLFNRHPSSRVVDGKKRDRHINYDQCTSTRHFQRVAMWRVDLQYIRRIERIVVYSRTDDKIWDENNIFSRKLLGFSIFVSNTTNPKNGIVCYDNRKKPIHKTTSIVDIFCSVVGRYVIYRNERLPGIAYPKGYSRYAYADLCEVEVFGCPVPNYGHEDSACTIPCFEMCKNYLENVSYKKPTWESSTDMAFGSSNKAVDGRYSSRHYSSGQCAISVPSTKVTWWVNLEKIVRIYHVVIYIRTDDAQWGSNNHLTGRPLGFSMYISNTTNRHDGVLCHHDTTYTKQTISDHVFIDCPYYGQYVIYYNERLPGVAYPPDYSKEAYSDICEVEVYGCPSPVTDIQQCSNPCPTNCDECFPGTGMCMKCFSGFKGSACEIVCNAIVKNITVQRNHNFTGSILDDIHTSKGITFAGNDLVTIDVYLMEESTNLASMSFSIYKTNDVNVIFSDESHSYAQQYYRLTEESEHWDVTVENTVFSKVASIQIIVNAESTFTISNLILPLRVCFKSKR